VVQKTVTVITSVLPMVSKILETQTSRLTSATAFWKKYLGLLKSAKAQKNSKKIVAYSKNVMTYKAAKADAATKISVATAQKKILNGAAAKAKKVANKKTKSARKTATKVLKSVRLFVRQIKRQVTVSAKKAKAVRAKKIALK
jgi:hypothetical protein